MSNLDIEVHILSSLCRNQERIQSQSKLGKHRAKYFGELALSQKVTAHKNKQLDQQEILQRVDFENNLDYFSSKDTQLFPTKSVSSIHHQLPIRESVYDVFGEEEDLRHQREAYTAGLLCISLSLQYM
jgi:hypothetical protein